MLLFVKTITLEEIHANPHVLDPLLEAGEPVKISQSGKSVEIVPSEVKSDKFIPKKVPKGNHRARLIAMYGPDVFSSTVSVQEVFAELRCERSS